MRMILEILNSNCDLDCLGFTNLHLAVRAGDWNLRIASIKQMVAIFTACN